MTIFHRSDKCFLLRSGDPLIVMGSMGSLARPRWRIKHDMVYPLIIGYILRYLFDRYCNPSNHVYVSISNFLVKQLRWPLIILHILSVFFFLLIYIYIKDNRWNLINILSKFCLVLNKTRTFTLQFQFLLLKSDKCVTKRQGMYFLHKALFIQKWTISRNWRPWDRPKTQTYVCHVVICCDVRYRVHRHVGKAACRSVVFHSPCHAEWYSSRIPAPQNTTTDTTIRQFIKMQINSFVICAMSMRN